MGGVTRYKSRAGASLSCYEARHGVCYKYLGKRQRCISHSLTVFNYCASVKIRIIAGIKWVWPLCVKVIVVFSRVMHWWSLQINQRFWILLILQISHWKEICSGTLVSGYMVSSYLWFHTWKWLYEWQSLLQLQDSQNTKCSYYIKLWCLSSNRLSNLISGYLSIAQISLQIPRFHSISMLCTWCQFCAEAEAMAHNFVISSLA